MAKSYDDVDGAYQMFPLIKDIVGCFRMLRIYFRQPPVSS